MLEQMILTARIADLRGEVNQSFSARQNAAFTSGEEMGRGAGAIYLAEMSTIARAEQWAAKGDFAHARRILDGLGR